MEEQMGLAASAGMGNQQMSDVDQIVMLLQQGMSPEELIQAGVPEQLIMAAVEILTKQSTQVPAAQEGLAGMSMQSGMV